MPKPTLRKVSLVAVASVGAGLLLFGVEVLLAIPGPDDHYQPPSQRPVRLGGGGRPLVYVVLGDSTAAGRGGHYDQGIAMGTARHLAQSRTVTMVNLAVSGAKVRDVVTGQLPEAVRLKPDVVLLAVGANDVTHFTPSGAISAGLSSIVDQLTAARPGVRIVLTGSPAVGTARRFAQPLRWLAGLETNRVNRVVGQVIEQADSQGKRVVWAPIAHDTETTFAHDPTLFAPDRFHPNDRGYVAWLPTLNAALDKALR